MKNQKTITVKGIGNVSAKPDLIIITMSMTTTAPEYSKTMECAAKDIEAIRNAIISVNHTKQDLKTTNFNISTYYESYKDAKGNWKEKFEGYKCIHSLKLEFDFDMKFLGQTLTAISGCGAPPEFQITFSVKDKNAVSAKLLENAVANAKEKANILSKAAGVKLGEIESIDYSWGEVRLYSNTKFSDDLCLESEIKAMEIEPEEIEAADTVTVIWGIE